MVNASKVLLQRPVVQIHFASKLLRRQQLPLSPYLPLNETRPGAAFCHDVYGNERANRAMMKSWIPFPTIASYC